MKMSKPINKVVKKVLNHIADSELYEWPPQCAFIYYQPKRPNRNEHEGKEAKVVKKNDCTFK